MDIYLNGQMVNAEQATLSVHDAAFQHAVGLFETMHVQNGVAFALEAHLKRIQNSAMVLGLTKMLDVAPLAQAVEQTISHNEVTDARLRLTLTAGEVSLLKKTSSSEPMPTLMIEVTPPTQYDLKYFEEGILALIVPGGANPFDAMAGHKTLNYWPRLRTLRQAASVGAGEAIWLNVSNHLASGAVSNVFLVKGQTLLTPFARGEEAQGALPAPVLPGITREIIIDLAQKQGLDVQRKMLSVEEMLDADEVFLTNSSWQVLPVSRIEKQTIAQGKAGPTTLTLRQALLEQIETQTKNPHKLVDDEQGGASGGRK